MDDKLKVFWNLDVLVKMCRSKSDGPSLRIEEVEILEKIKSYTQEIEEINSQSEEESYDTSAEMADRNIEIITKKQLQTLKSNLKEKNKSLSSLKEEEKTLYDANTLLKETKQSQEKYILSMQERIGEATNYEVVDRYNALIAETTEKLTRIIDELEAQTEKYNEIQSNIVTVTEEIRVLEENINKKKKLLDETLANLENKENYIDKTKREKNNKRIKELEQKINKLSKRLEELRKDPKYLESKIKDVINNKDNINEAKPYLVELINTVIKVPYINVPADNSLEEELLKATQARDSFANEIDQKSYNILEADTPEKIRTDFLTQRIAKWKEELRSLTEKVELVDKDKEFHYEEKNQQLYIMIDTMRNDIREFERAYNDTPDTSISYKASLKAQIDEKKEDIIEAEKIATAFRKDESEDITKATRVMKYECEQITQSIAKAEEEIATIKNRLTSKKSGLIDITTKNKDKDTLKELAQTVIDIKHRRQFAETPLEIIHRLEEILELKLEGEIENDVISNNSSIKTRDYEEFTTPKKAEVPVEIRVTTDLNGEQPVKRGIKVINEAVISKPLEGLMEDDVTDEDIEGTEIQNPLGLPAIEEIDETVEEVIETPTVLINEEVEEKEEPIIEEQPDLSLEAAKEEIELPEEIEETAPIIEEPAEENIDNEVEEETIIAKETDEDIKIESEEDTEIVEEPVEESEPTDNQSEEQQEEPSESEQEKQIDKEIEDILGMMNSTSATLSKFDKVANIDEEDNTPLDIEAIINSKPEVQEENNELEEKEKTDLSITSMFNNTNNENNDNIVSSEDLTEELDKFINDLGIKESE